MTKGLHLRAALDRRRDTRSTGRDAAATAPSPPPREQHPTYAGSFRCIGPQCEDTCCGDWDIPVDKITYQRYREFPAEALGVLVAHFVQAREGTPPDSVYAVIHRKQDGACPFFGEDRMCAIQKQYGPALLSSTCSLYPRSLSVVSGVLEGSLSLSCPEAARQVLLQEDALEVATDLTAGTFRTDNVFGVREHGGLEAMALPIRAVVIALLRDRSRPVWQRLLMVAALCSRLDSTGGYDVLGLTEVLGRYRDTVGGGSSPELERLAAGIPERLEFALALSQQRCQDRDCSRRFQDVFWDFIEGIGSAESTGAEQDVQRFRQADAATLEPLLRRYPAMLENYLVNYVYQRLFPFGRAGSERFVKHTMAEEAVLLILQFSWMTTLLTGVAARYGPAFGTEHVVRTVQTFTRAVEHAPTIAEEALAFAHARGLNTMPGLARLLRT